MTVTTAEKLKELKRERAMRHRVYPRLIGNGKMTQADADKAVKIIDAVIEDYEKQAEAEKPQGSLL
jgi:hypothetical protein